MQNNERAEIMAYRVMHKFWLDLDKSDEEVINQLIDYHKRQRQFSRVIRDGIRLMWSLGQGNLDILFELFPWVMDTFYQRALAERAPQEGPLTEQLARLERLLLEQGNQPMTTASAGPKHLAVTTQIMPLQDEEDDEIVLIKKAKSSGTSAQNFLDAAFGLIQ
jgi:hypothetical protein